MTRYAKSEEWLRRAEQTIPLGSQTFSKSRTQYPVGISPLYIEKAKGSVVWDIDGNKYIDLVSSLASVILGYGDKKFNQCISAQLKNGVSFSLPGKLEAEVAEMICSLVPSAEMVRFGKNGTDATSAAVRLARAYTGRKKVIVCGYHGWQDWYIGSTSRNKGVPSEISQLTEKFSFNEILQVTDLIEKGDVACVIMEPMNTNFPADGFLENIRKITSKYGTLLIFDETITGFRFSEGGAQELFGVTPDLSTFGKGIANGFPLSAVVGKREIMLEMEEIFFSGTFGGELLSLSAAKHVLELHSNKKIVPTLIKNGDYLSNGTQKVIEKHKLESFVKISGHDTWKFLSWQGNESISSEAIKTYFLQQAFSKGILVLGTHNISMKHTPDISDKVLRKYDEIFGEISSSIASGDLMDRLKVSPVMPLFKVR